MKVFSFVAIVMVCLLLTACNKDSHNNYDIEEEAKYNMAIQDPVIFSKNKVAVADKTFYVNIEMTSGQYVFDESAGAFYGDNWTGQCQVHVYTDELDYIDTVNSTPISIFDGQPMDFKEEFSLVFDDYNNDGNPDFSLGQYISSNGYGYLLFSINQEGEVEKLDTGGIMFISERDYSIKLKSISPTSFKTSAYDNSIGETVEKEYQWEGSKFVAEDYS